MNVICMEFYRLIQDIIKSEEFLTLKHCKHHIKSNVYDHSIKVAYLCYRHHKRFGSRATLGELVRGALLHDYYLYDWHDADPSHKWHLFTHPKKALANALQHYPNLTCAQQDSIGRHMFPITPLPPRTQAGWIVCFYDKIAAISDYCGKNK